MGKRLDILSGTIVLLWVVFASIFAILIGQTKDVYKTILYSLSIFLCGGFFLVTFINICNEFINWLEKEKSKTIKKTNFYIIIFLLLFILLTIVNNFNAWAFFFNVIFCFFFPILIIFNLKVKYQNIETKEKIFYTLAILFVILYGYITLTGIPYGFYE